MARKQYHHYHVGMNVPGYLPEGDIDTYSSRRDAERAAATLKQQVLEDNTEPELDRWTASGSARSGSIYLTRPDREHDLGLHIWIYQCNESSCEDLPIEV